MSKTEPSGPPKIEKGIPIPRGTGKQLNSVRQAVRSLSVGDSFMTDKTAAARKAIYEVGLLTGSIFITRTVEGGTRVWRVQ